MHQLMLPTDSGEAHVTLIDTPGFNDSKCNDAEILSKITAEMCETYKQNRKFSGIIYFHRISDPRMDGSAIKQLRMFRELCGDDSGMLKNVVLATNRWDCLEREDVGVQRQTELKENHTYWKYMCQHGSQVTRFKGTAESALEIIRLVVNNTPVPLKIQHEMVNENKQLAETGAGRLVEAEIGNLCRKHEETVAAIREEMELALHKKDQEMQRLLRNASEHWEGEIDKLRKQQDILKAENEKAGSERRQLLKKMEDQKRELELVSKLQGEKGKVKADDGQTWKIFRSTRADNENLPEPERPQEQPERQRNEWDIKNVGYGPRQGPASATDALSAAIRDRKELGIIRWLLAKGADPALCIGEANRSALHVAAEVGYTNAMKIIIGRCAAKLDIMDSYCNTALVWAARNGKKAVVRILLAEGAKLDTKNRFGDTALIFAAAGGHEAIVHLLLEEEAKLDIANTIGYTALTYAASHGHEAIVRTLLKKGARLDIMTSAGETALMLAKENGRDAVARLLCKHGAGSDIVSIKSARG